MTSILIFHFQRNDLTCSILKQLADLDVIVVDDGSDEPFPEDSEDGIRVIRHETNLGYVKSVNRAMNLIEECEFVWQLNNDLSELTVPLLSQLETVLRENNKIAAVSPSVVPTGHPEMRPGPGRLNIVNFIDWPCPLVRVKAWNEIGGFDENLPGFGCDLDLCKRGRELGWQFAVLPRAKVRHQGSVTARQYSSEHTNVTFMNQYLTKKWGVARWQDLKR